MLRPAVVLAVVALLSLPGAARGAGMVGYFAGPTFGVAFDAAGGAVSVHDSELYADAYQADSPERLVIADNAVSACEEHPPDAGSDLWRYHCVATSAVRVEGEAGTDVVSVSGVGSAVVEGSGGTDVLTAFNNSGRVTLRGGAGSDVLSGRPNDGSSATLQNGVTLEGGDATDFLADAIGDDGGAPDTLDGGSGTDVLFIDGGGPGSYAGGAGLDYAVVTDGDARLSLDGQANDGALRPGVTAKGNLAADIENFLTGGGADVLIGNERVNQINAGDGNDSLDGGGGADVLNAGGGADTLAARDGNPEVVRCGEGTEAKVTVDQFDEVESCENVSASAELQPDRDGDGFEKPADCDDLNAAIRPTAFDTPGNGVDENCKDGDAVDTDRDKDGFDDATDCGPADPLIRPGAPEIAGNTVDENCDGDKAPLPRATAEVFIGAQPTRVSTRIALLAVTEIDGGEQIAVTCVGKGCRFARRTRQAGAKDTRVRLESLFKDAKLRPGARFVVIVRRADGVTKTTAFTVQRGKPPKRKVSCLVPPARQAGKC